MTTKLGLTTPEAGRKEEAFKGAKILCEFSVIVRAAESSGRMSEEGRVTQREEEEKGAMLVGSSGLAERGWTVT